MSDFDQSHAAVIGIDAYGRGVTGLHTAVADARAIARCLARDHGYSEPLLRLDRQATGQEIRDLLERRLPERVGRDDRLLLYFAGHGVARDGADGPRGFLLPQDARPTDESTWLDMATVRTALERLPCRHLLVILDCCFAGSFRWTALRSFLPIGEPLYDSQYQRFVAGAAWQVLTSASFDEKAMDVMPGRYNLRDDPAEDQLAEHSPFAAALLAGLGGAADSSRANRAPDGVITATELHQYISEELNDPCRNAGDAWLQTPGIWPLRRDNTGEYIFLSPIRPKQTRADPPLDDRHNPWRGLRPYRASDHHLLFGRERAIQELERRLEPPEDGSIPPLLVVVGASGAGKSSTVRAGLVPRLRAGAQRGTKVWRVAVAKRLADDPSAALRTALAELEAARRDDDEPCGPSLLVLDQFEEIYTQFHDPVARNRFLGDLMALIHGESRNPPPTRILITLRSDFEPRLAAFEAASSHPLERYGLPPLRADELREIVERPAQSQALFFEPATLIDDLIEQVVTLPGALPLLSFALAEMYRQAVARRRREGATDRALTKADHRAAGGVAGALQSRASDLYERADPARRRTIRRLFLRMISTEGGQLGRRRVALRELIFDPPDEQARVDRVLAEFTRARLLVRDEGHVEPAHDTLVLAWHRLITWRSASASTLPLARAGWRAAVAWDDDGRDPRLLWHADPRLPQLVSLAGELNRLELEFVDASHRRQRRDRRLLAGLSTGISGVLAGLSAYSFKQARLARSRLESAVDLADEILFTADTELASIAGTAEVRRRLLDASSELLDRLRAETEATGDRASHRRIVNHLRRGELAASHDDLSRVELEVQAAVAIAEDLARAQPRHRQWQRYLAVGYSKLGSAARALGDLDQAQEWTEKGCRILERLARGRRQRSGGDDQRWQRELAICHNRLGGLAEERGDLARAREHYEHSLTLKCRVTSPATDSGLRELFISYDKLGDLARAEDDPTTASARYRKSLEIKRQLARSAPSDPRWQRALAFSFDQLGHLAHAEGDPAEARRRSRQSLEIRRRLAAIDPGNGHWQRDLARSHEMIGRLAEAEGDLREAQESYRRGLEIRQRLIAADPRNALWRRAYDRCRQRLDRVAAARDPAQPQTPTTAQPGKDRR